MADKEPRKRKKRKENQKRDENEEMILPLSKEKSQAERSEEKSHDISHEPSIFAKSVFFILFSLLIVAVGVIFFTLHGVQRESWEETKEPVPESGLYAEYELHSAIPEEYLPSPDGHEGSEQSEIEPSTVQDAIEDDYVDMLSSVKPSEMHPWAEHIPQEKPEEQNIFNQIYEALEEELFEDEDDEDEDDDESRDDNQEGEHEDTEEDGTDYMEDSFFKVDDDEGDNEEELGASSTDGFEVIVEEVDIPTSQVLLDLQPSEAAAADVSDAAEFVPVSSQVPPGPVQESSSSFEADLEILASQSVAAEDNQAQLSLGEALESDTQEQNMDSEVPDTAGSDSARVEESSPSDEAVGTQDVAPVQQTVPEELDIIDWPEDEPTVDIAQKQEEVKLENSIVDEVPISSSSSAEEKQQSDDTPHLHELHEPKIYDESFNQISINNDENAPVDQEYAGDEPADESEDSLAQESAVENERAQETADFNLPYENAEVTNDYDFLFKEDIDEADRIVEKSPESALEIFDMLATKHPQSPRVAYGRARSLDRLAELKRKNVYLDQAIEAYKQVLAFPDTPEVLYLQAGDRCVNRLRFRGLIGKALVVQSAMSDKFPNNMDILNQLGVSYLWAGRGQLAKTYFQKVLNKKPDNGFAKVHLGFILKTEESKYRESIALMREGIASREEGVIDGRFYFHLGDALARVGETKEARLVYEDGVREGVFLSAYQRSLYNVDSLTGKPWWKPEDTPYYSHIKSLENNWLSIRNEALSLMDDSKLGFIPENEGLRDTGDWKQFELFSRGRKIVQNCKRAPRTCSLVESIPDASGCKRGQVKFSIMQPGTHVWAHTGPTNCRIRAHLGLVVPEGPRLRVANETKTWTEGKVIIFDDSFEHEVWHDGKSFRLVLIADFWHPELTPQQKATLSPI